MGYLLWSGGLEQTVPLSRGSLASREAVVLWRKVLGLGSVPGWSTMASLCRLDVQERGVGFGKRKGGAAGC